ncbi:hypothetical protein LTR36_002806 [Oleoguttula mirabilis]|uniref:GATA-type domain-containing protein n=1 Tax=Oleoguttula mirabilis TaxID=1507867 RepID=A0AAV9JJH9_9PEZI|nr:hypothetical protein LTR36_002806 [Oleoguttula mirabilis]
MNDNRIEVRRVPQARNWGCLACGDDEDSANTPWELGGEGQLYCTECIHDQFILAADDDSSWPPVLANVQLRINDFAAALEEREPGFVARYREASRMFSVRRLSDRILCPRLGDTNSEGSSTETIQPVRANIGSTPAAQDIRGHIHPIWFNVKYSAQDVARLLFEQRDLDYADAHPEMVATDYDPMDVDRPSDLENLHFEDLDAGPSKSRPWARRVVHVHDRYRNGDLKKLWHDDPEEAAAAPTATRLNARRVNHEFLGLLAAMRHVVTFEHKIARACSTPATEPFPGDPNSIRLRILFAHQVHMLQQRFRKFCRHSNDKVHSALRLRGNAGWRKILRTVRQLQLPGLPQDPGDLVQWQRLCDGVEVLLQDMLLSIGEERLRLAQQQGYAGEDNEPPRLPELYHLLLQMEPALGSIAHDRGGPEQTPIDWNALIQIRDFYNYDPGAGEFQPVFCHALKLLSSMLALPDQSVSSSGQTGPDSPTQAILSSGEEYDDPPPPRPRRLGQAVDDYFDHELDWIRDALVHQQNHIIELRERGEPTYDRVHSRTALLRDVYQLLLRLVNPNTHPDHDNHEMFERLEQTAEAINSQTSEEYSDFQRWSQADVDLFEQLTQFYLPVFRGNPETNPPQVRQEVVDRLQDRFNAARDAFELNSNFTSAEAITQQRAMITTVRMTFQQDRAHWSQPDGISEYQAQRFLRALSVIDRLLELDSIPLALYRLGDVLDIGLINTEQANSLNELRDLLQTGPIGGLRMLDYVPVITGLGQAFVDTNRQL